MFPNVPTRQPTNPKRKFILFWVVGLLFLLTCIALLIILVRYALYQREKYRELHTRNQYGTPLMMPALMPDGPTLGRGALADLELTDSGWEWYGPRAHPTRTQIFVSVRNKSEQTWPNLEAEFAMYDHHHHFIRMEPSPFGTLAPGQSKTVHYGPVEPEMGMFVLRGFKSK